MTTSSGLFNRKEYMLAYQKDWMKKRRNDWLSKNGPCKVCGSDLNLEVDHINPEDKVTHQVWSWAKDRREAELKKCQVLCKICHKNKTAEYLRARFKGIKRPERRTVKDSTIKDAVKYIKQGCSERLACKKAGISRGTFSSMKIRGERKELFS